MDDDILEAPDNVLWSRLDDAQGFERGRILEELGDRANRRDDQAEVETLYESAAAAFREAGADGDVARNLYWLGRTRAGRDLFELAIQTLAEASDIYREVGDQAQIAACHASVAYCRQSMGEFEPALQEFESAERLYAAAGDLEGAGRAAMSRGEILGGSRRLNESLDHFRRARGLFRSMAAPKLVLWADDRTAAALIDLGRLAEAIELLRGCVLVADTGGGARDQAYAAYRLGWTLRLNEQYEEALASLERSYGLYSSEGDMHYQAGCDYEAGHAHSGLRDFAAADHFLIRARAVFDALGEDGSVDLCDAGRADNFRLSGDFESALQIGERALAQAAANGSAWVVTNVVTGMAENLLDLGRPSEAAQLLAHPDYSDPDLGEILRETNHRRYVLAAVAVAVGDLEQAAELSEQGIAELTNTDAVGLLADMHRVHSDVVRVSDEDAANRELAFAVALYLAAGDVRTATRHSRRILAPELEPVPASRGLGRAEDVEGAASSTPDKDA